MSLYIIEREYADGYPELSIIVCGYNSKSNAQVAMLNEIYPIWKKAGEVKDLTVVNISGWCSSNRFKKSNRGDLIEYSCIK